MANHLAYDLQNAYLQLIQLSGSVEQMIDLSVRALIDRNTNLSQQVIASDSDIDRREVQIEENCLTMLALHQPVAADLRRITMMLKINNELEQMADLACNIAQRSGVLATDTRFAIPPQMTDMANMVRDMVTSSMNSFINSDSGQAYRVLESDDRVDAINTDVINNIEASIAEMPSVVVVALHCFSASRSLEQIADHATSIAEDVIYMVTGEIVRHRRTLSEEFLNAKK